MKKTKLKELLLLIIAVGAGSFVFLYVVTCTYIGFTVKDNCQKAKSYYLGSCVEALSKLVEDENRSFKERNDAVWALGQLGDSKALPVLEKYYTGDIPNREPYNSVLSQYELKKAVNLAKGGLNISAWIWRSGPDIE